MTPVTAIILGFVEGATEFLPISSSGHLIVARQLLHINDFGGLSFDAVIQLATSCAILVYFWRDVLRLIITALQILSRHVFLGARINRWCDFAQSRLPAYEVSQKDMSSKNLKRDETMFWAIVLGTIPAVIFGLLFETYMDTVFRNVHLVAITLVLGSGLFWFAQYFSENNKKMGRELTVWKGIVVGFFQCLALVPGVSRSGATISGGLLSGLTQEESVRFSFLLSIPILFGAGLKKLFEVRHELFSTGFGSSILLSSVVAFVTGLVAINFLIKYLKSHNLNLFIWYRVILAILIFVMF